MAVDVASTAETIAIGAPKRLFRAPVSGGPDQARDHYAAAADGTRFLVDGAAGNGGGGALTVIIDWAGAVRGSIALASTARR